MAAGPIRKPAPKAERCRGAVRSPPVTGKPCPFHAMPGTTYCSRHYPPHLLPKAKLKVERLKRELRAAREDVYQLRHFTP